MGSQLKNATLSGLSIRIEDVRFTNQTVQMQCYR
jgi:hypothetical protein